MGSIVCGVDDSESAKEAARVARALSAKLGQRIVFVRADAPLSPCEKASMLARRDCSAGRLVDADRAADRLVAAAAEENATFIVVGSNGPYGSLLGSTSAETPPRAPCPVVVVPDGSDARSTNGHRQRDVTGLRLDDDRNTRDFAGGIVRFNLGSRTNES